MKKYNDIRFCPWEVSIIDGIKTRVHRYNGYECCVTVVYTNYPHAPIYYYSLKYPDGKIQRNLDLSEVNKIIFSSYSYGMHELNKTPVEKNKDRLSRAYLEVVNQLYDDFAFLVETNGSAMSSVITHNTYGWVCDEEGRGMFYVRFEGETKWHSIY